MTQPPPIPIEAAAPFSAAPASAPAPASEPGTPTTSALYRQLLTQGELSEAIEAAQEVASYESEEDETVTATSIKKVLKDLMDDLKNVSG